MELNLYNQKGKKLAKKVKLDDRVFASKVNKPLMRIAVHVYLVNQRQSTAHTKGRGEVRGGGAKPWKQKGTGRARHGSIRSPIWKGGGVAFGPRADRNYKRKFSGKMRKAAIRSAFSYFAKNKKITILERLDLDKARLTKQVVKITRELPLEEKVLYIQKGNLKDLYLGSRNLKRINVVPVNELNVYTMLNHKSLVILQDALEDINKFWCKGATSKEKKPKGKVVEKIKRGETKKVAKASKKEQVLEESGFSKRVVSALLKQNITSKGQVVDLIKKGKKIEGIGSKSLDEIKEVLKIK